MKFLIVEDSIAMRRVIRNSIMRFYVNCEFQEAHNGLEAIDILKLEDIDFLITDWLMPGVDGIELTKTVRDSQRAQNIPILMVTTKGNKMDIIEAIKAGVNDYLVKPVSPTVLENKIKSLVEKFEINTDN